jgi:hypothetical protein
MRESKEGCGEALARCGWSDSVFSSHQVAGLVALALQRKVLHGGGLLGVVVSVPLFLFDARLRRWFGDCMCAVGG